MSANEDLEYLKAIRAPEIVNGLITAMVKDKPADENVNKYIVDYFVKQAKPKPLPAVESLPQCVYDYELKKLNSSEMQPLSEFKGKALLIVNVASLCGYTRTNYPQLNKLQDLFGHRGFSIIGIPCNQFGLMENCAESELMSALEHVRPGKGYKPNFPIFGKALANGPDAIPLYQYLRQVLGYSMPENHNWVSDTRPKNISVTPTQENELRWNFEKFLIDKRGKPVKRFAPTDLPDNIAPMIERYMEDDDDE